MGRLAPDITTESNPNRNPVNEAIKIYRKMFSFIFQNKCLRGKRAIANMRKESLTRKMYQGHKDTKAQRKHEEYK
jgi:hypothetical protein